VLRYSTTEERERILKVIEEHNTPGQKLLTGTEAIKLRSELFPTEKVSAETIASEGGEELEQIMDSRVLERSTGEMYSAILCGNGGGRSFTFRYFRVRGIDVCGYTSSIHTIL